MKLNKIIFPLMIALVAMLATTGCKKGFNGKTTPLPGARNTGITGNEQPPDTKPFVDPNANINANPFGPQNGGPIAQNQDWKIEDTIPDPAALADQTVYFAFDSAAILSKEESKPVSYTHLRAHETRHDLVCRLLL